VTMLDRLRFLASKGDLGGARQVLVIQTGSPELLSQAVEMLQGALPGVRMTVLLQRDMRARMRLLDGVDYLENDASKLSLIRDLASRRFDAAFVLYVDQPGYWKLKLLPFLIGVPRVFAVNEHMGWFPIALRSPGPLLRHLKWRAGTERTGVEAAADITRAVVRSAATPAIAAWLYAYERIASARAALGGGVRWKNDPPSR
jgi:hypothetical protein